VLAFDHTLQCKSGPARCRAGPNRVKSPSEEWRHLTVHQPRRGAASPVVTFAAQRRRAAASDVASRTFACSACSPPTGVNLHITRQALTGGRVERNGMTYGEHSGSRR
jgi:hypothetical protein